MIDKEWLDRVALGAKIYNENRMHRDFQETEVQNFVAWLYKQYGLTYQKPESKNINYS